MSPLPLDGQSVSDAVEKLPDDLRARLGILAGEDEGVTLLSLSAMPTGSRAYLAALGIIEPGSSPRDLKVTPLGFMVINRLRPWGEREWA